MENNYSSLEINVKIVLSYRCNKNHCNFYPRRMEVAMVLYFLRNGVKLHFYSLGTIFEENMRVSRGMQSLGSGFPIGARKHPCWHTIFLGKSSVLYLLLPLALKRGCLM